LPNSDPWLDDDVMVVKELPITNSTNQDLRLGVRPAKDFFHGPDHHGRDYSMEPGDEWCIHAPGRSATFAIQVGTDAIVVLVHGCDIDDVSIIEHPVFERPARAIVPIGED
jgi:hypothetical protein